MALANIIDYTNFAVSEGILYLDVDGTDDVAVAAKAKLNGLIIQYQKDVFKNLLGEALYQYLTDNEGELVYTTLVNGERITFDDGTKARYEGLKVMLASFVYFHYKSRTKSFDTGSGEMQSTVLNAKIATNDLNRKIIEAWNQGVDLYLDAISYIDYKNSVTTDYYPNFSPDYSNYAIELTHGI